MNEWIENFLYKDLPNKNYWIRIFQNGLKFIYFVRIGFKTKFFLQRAADLAYISLVAMVPTLAIFLSIISSVKFFPQDIEKKIEILIFQYIIPETSQKLSEKVALYAQDFANAAGTIGLIGTLCMLFTVYLLLSTIESHFNDIMNAERERSIFHKLSAYTSSMVWISFLVGLSFALESNVEIPFINQLNFFYRYVLIIGTFTLAYKIIPTRQVPTLNAFVGGTSAAILWALANRSFSDIVSKMVNYDKIYGALGAIPLFLLWLYMVWLMVLIGMEITYVSQYFKSIDLELSPAKSLDRWVVRILAMIGRGYLKGENITYSRFLNDLNISEKDLKKILEGLEEQGIIVRLFQPANSYSLARNPDHIRIWKAVSLYNDSFSYREGKENSSVEYVPIRYGLPKEVSNLSLGEWLKNNPV